MSRAPRSKPGVGSSGRTGSGGSSSPGPSPRSREAPTFIGTRGEELAAAFLRARGYRLIARNFKSRTGEIDIIAADGDVLVFVEVRYRASDRCGSVLETVNQAKQQQLVRVARDYLMAHPLRLAACRFDVIGITGERIDLIKDAFRAGIDY